MYSYILRHQACFQVSIEVPCDTYRLAIPAFLTAEEIALMAVHMELRSVVSSPVPLAFRPSSKTNLVSVITLVSKAPVSDIVSCGL